MFFVGIVDSDVEGNWGVHFPDVPGAVSAGGSADEAIANAIEALRDVVDYRRKAGLDLPHPRSLLELRQAGAADAGQAAVMIPLLLDGGRTVRANVTFEANLLEAIDEAAAQRGLTRSAFLASAARDKIMAI